MHIIITAADRLIDGKLKLRVPNIPGCSRKHSSSLEYASDLGLSPSIILYKWLWVAVTDLWLRRQIYGWLFSSASYCS